MELLVICLEVNKDMLACCFLFYILYIEIPSYPPLKWQKIKYTVRVIFHMPCPKTLIDPGMTIDI